MGMLPLKDLPHYYEIKKLKQRKRLNDEEKLKLETYEREFYRHLYQGKYKAIFLDEVLRTDGSKESREFVELQTGCRYGKYTHNDIMRLKEMTATEEETNSEEWKNATYLTAYHFHNEKSPLRTNVDSSNAKCLVENAEKCGQHIMLFKAEHLPVKEAINLEKISSKEFKNTPNNLYLMTGAPIIITENINASLSLFNGAKGKFIGPMYLPDKYSITDFDTFLSTMIDASSWSTTKPIEITLDSGKRGVLQAGAALLKINGEDFSSNTFHNLDEASFESAIFSLPRRPPYLPNYLVVEIEGYSDSGGPSFFPGNDHMKNFVCIKPRPKEIHLGMNNEKSRKQFPVELSYVMTAFKGIGATHQRTIAKISGMFGTPGLFYVATTRVKNPKHLHIPIDQMPTFEEASKQRSEPTVLESENFERMVRAKSDQEMRKSKYCHTMNGFPNLDKEIVNKVADAIHDQWLSKGNSVKHSPEIQEEIKQLVLKNVILLIQLRMMK